MLRLIGIRLNRAFVALAGVAVLVIGLVAHGPALMALGGLLVVSAAVGLAASRRR
jgi:hypothetical protein